MPKYGKSSKNRLDTCHGLLKKVFNKAIEIFDISITEGHRPEERQNELFEKGLSKLRFPEGKHNSIPSMAVDAVPYSSQNKRSVDYRIELIKRMEELSGKGLSDVEKQELNEILHNVKRWYYFGGLIVGIGHALGINIRWGGDWDGDGHFTDQSFHDLPHFEIKE